MAWDHSRASEKDLILSQRDRQGMVFPSSSRGLVICLISNIMAPPVAAMLYLPPVYPWTSHLTGHHPFTASLHPHLPPLNLMLSSLGECLIRAQLRD